MNELEIEIRKNRFWFNASFLLTAFVICLCVGMGLVSSATCNGTGNVINSTTISDGCTINTAGIYTSSGQNFQLNGSTNGAIIISTSNVLINWNGSILTGNYTQTGSNSYVGIRAVSRNNITINNITITNFDRASEMSSTSVNFTNSKFISNRMGIWVTGSSLKNQTYISNNNFTNNSHAGVWLYSNRINDTLIDKNIFFLSGGIGVRQENTNTETHRINITNNVFYQSTTTTDESVLCIESSGTTSDQWFINNNSIYGGGVLYSEGVDFRCKNSIISNNYVEKTQYGLACNSCYNVTFANNIYKQGDIGGDFSNSNLIFYINNTVINMSANMDSYYIGPKFKNVTNGYIINNTFNQTFISAMVLQGNTNITISGNYIYFVPFSERSNYIANNGYEPTCGIQATKRYKGFDSQFGNKNLTIINNFFDENNPCYLNLENVSELYTDISNYWYPRPFELKSSFSGKQEFYIPLSTQNLTRYSPSQGIRYDMRISNGGGDTNGYVSYIIDKDFERFQNINQTSQINMTYFETTNSLIYFSNGSVACSDISTCNGNINITLSPNNYSYVLDNYNKTIGVTRLNDPIISNLTRGTITNSLTSQVTFPFYDPTLFSLTMQGGEIMYTDFIVNYTYTYNSNEQNGYSEGTTFIIEDILGMVGNFFALSPVVGTILGVCVLIGGIVMLVIYIKKFASKDQEDEIQG